MRPKIKRVAGALARLGIEATHQDGIWSFTSPEGQAEVLLPEGFPLERKAVKQLMALASVSHPGGGGVECCVATPDFHPGDSGIAIGSVVQTRGMVIPSAVGRDINCGMRLHVVDLSEDVFAAKKRELAEVLKGDYLLGTRDLVMNSGAMRGAFAGGLMGWLAGLQQPRGSLADADMVQIEAELDRVYESGSLQGALEWVPEEAIGEDWIRDQVLGSIGGGNHFVEIQRVAEVVDKSEAYRLGVRKGQLAFMIHSGSRKFGQYVGDLWVDRTRKVWPKGVAHPPIMALHADSPAAQQYLEAERTAANYGFLNRQMLAESMRRRLRQVFGDVECPLVFDLPHNITEVRGDGWVTRKGACPAHSGQPVIIPGSMGTSSYLLVGCGNPRFLESASHGAGRAISRFKLGRRGSDWTDSNLGLDGVECITLREERRIEEAPAAYKPITPVIEAQVDAGMVSTVARFEPILTFKG